MKTSTIEKIRMGYYTGVILLIINAFPELRKYVDFIFDYPIGSISALTLIAILTSIGLIMDYRKDI